MRAELFTRIADNEWLLTISSQETDRIELKSWIAKSHWPNCINRLILAPLIRS